MFKNILYFYKRMSDVLNNKTKKEIINIWKVIRDDYKDSILQLHRKNLRSCDAKCGTHCLQKCEKIDLYFYINLQKFHLINLQEIYPSKDLKNLENEIAYLTYLLHQFITCIVNNQEQEFEEDDTLENYLTESDKKEAISFYCSGKYSFSKSNIYLKMNRFLKTMTSQNLFITDLDNIITDPYLVEELRSINNDIIITNIKKNIKYDVEEFKKYHINLWKNQIFEKNKPLFLEEINKAVKNNLDLSESIRFEAFIQSLIKADYYIDVIKYIEKAWKELIISETKILQEQKNDIELQLLLEKVKCFINLKSISFCTSVGALICNILGATKTIDKYTYYYKNKKTWSVISDIDFHNKFSQIIKDEINLLITSLEKYNDLKDTEKAYIKILEKNILKLDGFDIIKNYITHNFNTLDMNSKKNYNFKDQSLYEDFFNTYLTYKRDNRLSKSRLYDLFVQKYDISDDVVYDHYNKNMKKIIIANKGLSSNHGEFINFEIKNFK